MVPTNINDSKNFTTLVIITAEYPFGKREVFLEKELKEFSNHFARIYIFPQTNLGKKSYRLIPDNCEVHLDIADVNTAPKKYLFSHFGLITKWYFTELVHSKKFFYVLKTIRDQIEVVVQDIHKAKILDKKISSLNLKDALFYSVWMDDAALMLSVLKQKKRIRHFVFRLHGYDLFDERRVGNYMPFRIIKFSYASIIFILSKYGQKYLENKCPDFKSKYCMNYSGLYDNGINPPSGDSVFTIVSCSNVISAKRVDKIAAVIELLKFPVKWYHFGDGCDLDKIKKQVAHFPNQIEVILKGHVNNLELIQFYQSVHVDLFIHLSESEGLGMAIVEAQSFGIPALVADAQGTSETFGPESGILVSQDTPELALVEIIQSLHDSPDRLDAMRVKAKEFFLKNFDATVNHPFDK